MTKTLRPNQPTTKTAETQLTALLGRLQAAERVIENADPLDVDALTKAYAEKSALERAVTATRERLAAEAIQAQADAQARREAERQERVDAAMIGVKNATQAAIDAVLRLDAGVFVDLDKAVVELGQAGGSLPEYVVVVTRLRRDVRNMIDRMSSVNPAAVGKPPAPSAKETAIEETKIALARMEALLEVLKQAAFPTNDERTYRLGECIRAINHQKKRLGELTGTPAVIVDAEIVLSNLTRYYSVPRKPAAEVAS